MMKSEIELAPGFRFHPTDEELVIHYLCRKCASQSISVPIIKEIDLYKFDPWNLPEMALYGEKEWYFFSPRDRKYPNGSRPNRAAGTGYWKATGADKPIGKPKTLGIKKALVFYAGKAPRGIKTNWIMHEYRLANVDRSARNKNNNLRLDDWVLCRIYNKKGKIEKYKNNNNNNNNAEDETTSSEISKFDDDHHEIETKPDISGRVVGAPPPSSNDQLYRETSESSCSEHVLSPDVTCEREVQSEPKWKEQLGFDLDFDFNFMEDNNNNGMNINGDNYLFAPPLQYSPFQDVFMSLQNPF